MDNVEKVLVEFGKLSEDDKKKALARMALQVRTTKQDTVKHNRDADMWIEAVVETLRKVLKDGGGSVPSPAALKRLQADSWEPVEVFMREANLQSLTVTERQAVFYLLAGLLVEHAKYVAKRSGAPLSAKLTFSCVRNLPGLFDEAFPGYLANGLAKTVILRKISR